MRPTKRVILADESRLVREMLHRVIDKAEYLQVVDELSNYEGLRTSIKRFDPEWVIVSQPYSNPARHWIDGCMADHPAVGFVFLSAKENSIKMKWQRSDEKEYSDLSLKEFLQILEKDLQHT